MSCDLRVPPAPAAFLLAVLGAPSALASGWQVLPITEELRIDTAAVSRVDSDHAFAWSGIGYRSTDGGDTWEQLVCSFEGRDPAPPLAWVEFDPVDANTIWAVIGGQPVRSTDFGETWWDWGAPPPAPLVGFVPDLVTPATAAWAIGGSGATRGPYRTTDAGATWVPKPDGLLASVPVSIAPNPTDPLSVLLGTGDGVARTTDAGESWHWVRVGPEAHKVRWHPDGAHVATIERSQQRLLSSSDGGSTWDTGAATTYGWDYEFDELDPMRLLSTSLTWCLNGSYGWAAMVRTTTDTGDSWSTDYLSSCFSPYVGGGSSGIDLRGDRAWVWQPALPSGRGALHRSTDRGESWHSIVNGFHESPTRAMAAGKNSVLWWQGESGRARYSTDRGDSWTWSAPPFRWSGFIGRSMEASELRAGDLFATAAWVDYDIAGIALWRSTDGGASWMPDYGEPEGIETFQRTGVRVAYNHGTGDTVYAWISMYESLSNGSLYRSDDGNLTYTLIDDDMFFPIEAVISPKSDAHVYAAVQATDPVWFSSDSGVTWETRSSGLPERVPVQLLVGSVRGDHLVVVFEVGLPFESLDGGLTWRALRGGLTPDRGGPDRETRLLPETAALRGVTMTGGAWDVVDDIRRVFLSTDHGPWISDHGFLSDGLPIRQLDGITYSRATERILTWSRDHGAFAIDWPAIPLTEGRDGPALARSPAVTPLVVAPNPFGTNTRVSFGMAIAGDARVDVFDPAGRLVTTLVSGGLAAGGHTYTWSGKNDAGRNVAPGVYFVRLTSPDRQTTRRIVRLR